MRLVKKLFLSMFARLNAINVVTHVISQHDRNNIASSLTFVLVRNEIRISATRPPAIPERAYEDGRNRLGIMSALPPKADINS